MSHTVSRGMHTASRWSTPALVVVEQIELAAHGTTEVSIPRGALEALEQFFHWVLVGISRGERIPMDPRVPLMASICALSIASDALAAMSQKRPTIYIIKRLAQRHLALIRKMKDAQGMAGAKTERERLRRFLVVIVRQGQVARSR